MFFDTTFLKNNEIRLLLEKTVDGNEEKGWVPAYHFAICNLEGTKMGSCDLRIGHNEKLYYGGNIGYRVEEQYRGHHYAGKACLLLFELARKHGVKQRNAFTDLSYRRRKKWSIREQKGWKPTV